MKSSESDCVCQPSSRAAMTLLELIIVVMLIALLVALAVPMVNRPRENARTSICVHNLRQIVSAKEVWALEKGKSGDDEPTPTELAPYLKNNIRKIVCPSGGEDATFESSYVVGTVSEHPTCAVLPDKHKQ